MSKYEPCKDWKLVGYVTWACARCGWAMFWPLDDGALPRIHCPNCLTWADGKPPQKSTTWCELCRFWSSYKDGQWGTCRYNPPVIVGDAAFWPSTKAFHWCGKFEPRGDE